MILLDYGLHLYIPVLKFYSQPIKGKSTPEQSWLPNLDVSLDYAISAGLEWFYARMWYEVFKVEYSVDVTDLLISGKI